MQRKVLYEVTFFISICKFLKKSKNKLFSTTTSIVSDIYNKQNYTDGVFS